MAAIAWSLRLLLVAWLVKLKRQAGLPLLPHEVGRIALVTRLLPVTQVDLLSVGLMITHYH